MIDENQLKSDSCNTAIELMTAGKWPEAYQILVQADKTYGTLEIKNLLALCLMKCDCQDQAIEMFLDVLQQEPSYEVLNNLAICYSGIMEFDKSIKYLIDASIMQPKSYTHLANLGHAYRMKKDFHSAISFLEKAIEFQSNDANVYVNLAWCYGELAQFDKAKEILKKALAVDPEHVPAKIDLGCLEILAGDWKEGWEAYKCRFQHYPHLKKKLERYPPETEWKGEDIEGKTLRVFCEQGLGDVFNFLRFVPLIKNANIQLECPEEVRSLLSANDYPVEWVGDFDKHCSLFNLPLLLQLSPEQIQNSYSPYLKSNNVADLSQFGDKLKIGIAWAGNPRHNRDALRSCELSLFRKFNRLENVQLFSLQKDIRKRVWPGCGEVDLAKNCSDLKVIDLREYIIDWNDTASLIEAMDLIITIDTSILHLAGAMGKKTWAAIPFLPDFRWLTKYEDTNIWYPSVKLFRQQKYADWESVFDKMYQELLQTWT